VSDYLTDEEQMARLKTWWEQYGRALVAALVLGVAGVIGWRWYDDTRQVDIAAASDLYADYLDTEGEAREQFARNIAEQIPESAYHSLVLMRSARDSVAAEDFEMAETHLRSALAAADSDVLNDLINVRLAKVLQQRDKADEALQTLAQVRGEGFRPVVAELQGDIHLSRGERALAHESYKSALEGVADVQRSTQRALLELKVLDTADAVDA
jgi:predicted negative regulator of RcsB-dependent stress response